MMRSATRRPLTRLERRQRRSRLALRGSLMAVLVGATGLVAFVAGLLHAPVDFGLPPAPRPAVLYAADGVTQLATIRPSNRRVPVKATDIPQVMRNAIIAAEDERFLDHKGVDVKAIARALLADLAGGRRQGGSTITQQYVKNVYVDDAQTLRRKVQEAGLAYRLEKRLDKQRIITNYLNVLYLGEGNYGVEAASQYYFGVPVKDLDKDPATGARSGTLALARAAMLAGIAPAPSVYNPVYSARLAKARQTYTLNRMKINGMITTAQASAASGIVIRPVQKVEKEAPSVAPEFTDKLKEQLKRLYGGDERVSGTASETDFYGSGLRVKSTLDMKLQMALAQAMREVLPRGTDPQAAAVVIEIGTGNIKAMSTLLRRPARTFTNKKTGKQETTPAATGYEQAGINLATNAYRSTGSTIKPFTLATALQSGRSLDDFESYPGCETIPIKGADDYRYCNASGEGSGGGGATLAGALARSVNTVYVPLAIEVGRAKVRSLAVRSGFKVFGKDSFSVAPLSFGLGSTAEVTTLSLANAFATLMNGGVRVTPRYFTEVREGGTATSRGRVKARAAARPKGARAMPKAVADQVKDAMSAVATGAGTAPRAAQPWTVYGKTGTTNDSNDARFVGCGESEAGNVCLSVWMGYEYINCKGVDGPCGGMRNLYGNKQVYGGTLPAQIFARTFQLYRAGERALLAPPAPAATTAPSRSADDDDRPTTQAPAPRPVTSRRPTSEPSAVTTLPPVTTAPAEPVEPVEPVEPTPDPVTPPPAQPTTGVPGLFGPRLRGR